MYDRGIVGCAHFTPMHFRRLLRQIINSIRAEQKQSTWEAASRNNSFLEVSTSQGKYRITTADKVISQSLYFNGSFELNFMQNTVALLREIGRCSAKGTGTILDVGGNIGITSIGMLHTGEFARAVAIEPEPNNFALLQYNVALNSFEQQILCLPFAAADQAGEVLFELSTSNFGDHRVKVASVNVHQLGFSELYQESNRKVTHVPAKTLDSMISELPQNWIEDLSLIWMDIQGYEGYAFQGASVLLSRNLPAVIEVWPYGLLRAGTKLEEFCAFVSENWSNFWVWRRSKFVNYPIQYFPLFLSELGCDTDHDNVILCP
jgi:FkbM family methyltransferase